MNRVRLRVGTMVITALLLMSGPIGTRPAQADSGAVAIQNFAFNPSPLHVPVGTTVTWTNYDGDAHTTTSNAGTGVSWDSGVLFHGSTFSFTFSQGGSYTYHCSIHPLMQGTIIVGSGGNPPTSTPIPTSIPTSVVPTDTSVPTTTTAPTVASTSTAVPMNLAPTIAPSPTMAPSPTSASTAIVKKSAKKTIAARSKGQTFSFSPASTTVKVGTRVTWVNHSQAEHTVTSKGKGWKFNKTLNKKSVSFTFKKAGTYLYHCLFHPRMVGKIIVKK